VAEDYDSIKDKARQRILAASQKGRDIAEDFPPTDSINWGRRTAAFDDLRTFLETYFPSAFYLGWSPDHLKAIAKLQTAIVKGGLFALAMPRGSGKTTIVERAALWAILTGRRQFIVLVGATQDAAERLLMHIKTELQFNDLLAQDFPTACYPIRRLENNAKRCVGQHCAGRQTLITWTADRLAMPTIDRSDSTCSGACISCCGLTGNIRGQIHTTADGQTIRPNFVMLDDPQTRESAASPSQTQRRLEILMGDILGLAGPGQTLSAVCPCTVIYRSDLAFQLLDREVAPQWQGERSQLIYKFPTNTKLWDEYRLLRDESFRRDGDGSEATEFYRLRQKEMDEGAVVGWESRFNPDEISAVQHAMNLFFRDAASFFAEYQNDPQYSAGNEQELPQPKHILQRVNNYKRCEVPVGCQWITAFIDVQQTLLYYCVCAWQPDFTGYVGDYGRYPDQTRPYFRLSEAKITLQSLLPGSGLDGQLYNGLEKLVDFIMSRPWNEGGTARHIDRILVDSGYNRDTIVKFCRESRYARVVMPSKGQFVGATSKPYDEYRKIRGDINGHHWRIPRSQTRGDPRHVMIDTNYWKSFLFQCVQLAKGDPGALTLWGNDLNQHRMFADQLCSEVCIQVSTRDRTVSEWKEKPNRPDNHLLDCAVGCMAGASMCGARVLDTKPQIPVKQKQPEKKQQNKVKYFDF